MTHNEKDLNKIAIKYPNEIWKVIPDYSDYAVSNVGNIVTINTGRLRKFSDHKGYKQCMVRKNGKSYNKFVHRLVANAFLPNSSTEQVIDHINGIRDDNRVKNLRWCTVNENLHFPLAKDHRKYLYKPCSQYTLEGIFKASYISLFEAENQTGINSGAIHNCCVGRKLSAGGYQWNYGTNCINISPIRKNKRNIEIAQYDLNNKFIAIFPSCLAAAKENNLKHQVINECVKGNRKTAYGGYFWRKL